MNFALIATTLVGLVAALCGLVIVNLKSQRRNVQATWRRLNDLRRNGLDAVPTFIAAVSRDDAATGRAIASPSIVRRALADVESALHAASQTDGPLAAADADDRVVRAIERVYAAAEVDLDFVASAASRKASAQLDAAMEAITHEQQIYNNVATIAANAQRSFPALLFVKRLGLSEPQRYESEAAARRAALDWTRESLPSLADASPHVMNPQMLWASSMADAAMDDRTDERCR